MWLSNICLNNFFFKENFVRTFTHIYLKYPAVVAEWYYERLQIQVAETNSSRDEFQALGWSVDCSSTDWLVGLKT